jgi:hypothetical protein
VSPLAPHAPITSPSSEHTRIGDVFRLKYAPNAAQSTGNLFSPLLLLGRQHMGRRDMDRRNGMIHSVLKRALPILRALATGCAPFPVAFRPRHAP